MMQNTGDGYLPLSNYVVLNDKGLDFQRPQRDRGDLGKFEGGQLSPPPLVSALR